MTYFSVVSLKTSFCCYQFYVFVRLFGCRNCHHPFAALLRSFAPSSLRTPVLPLANMPNTVPTAEGEQSPFPHKGECHRVESPTVPKNLGSSKGLHYPVTTLRWMEVRSQTKRTFAPNISY